jgi:hypothetical protein
MVNLSWEAHRIEAIVNHRAHPKTDSPRGGQTVAIKLIVITRKFSPVSWHKTSFLSCIHPGEYSRRARDRAAIGQSQDSPVPSRPGVSLVRMKSEE